MRELETRIAAAGAELEARARKWPALPKSGQQHREFLDTAAGEARDFRQNVEERQLAARAASEEVFRAEREMEASRRHAMHLLTFSGNARNHMAQGEESLAALEREAGRLEGEMTQANEELTPGRAKRRSQGAV